MADVFVSYARSSAKKAARVAARLRESGYSVWFDEELPAHRSYADVIATELDDAAAVLVLWSEEAGRSHWVRSEASRALETGRLVQARLDEARLPMPFDQVQCADLRNGKQGWQGIERGIAALASREPASTSSPATPSRRTLLIRGGAAALGIAGLVAGWQFLPGSESSPEAQLLLQKGMDALQANDALDTEDPGSTLQAIAFLRDATVADPGSAQAWGALAMAYAVRKKTAPLADRPGLDERGRSAARNALRLDSTQLMALGGLLMLDGVYRRWLAAEREHRQALRHDQNLPLLLFLTSDLLGQVGRWSEATKLTERLDRTKFRIPGADRRVLINRWSAGNLQGADEAAIMIAEQWPQHPQVWRTRIAYLLFSGRPEEGLSLIDSEAERPPDTPPQLITALRATGQALARRVRPSEAIEAARAYLEFRPAAALQVAQAVSVLGDHALALLILEGYFFGEGQWASLAPAGGDEDRLTAPLFQPPMSNLWTRPEFEPLLTRIGLTRYWRESGTVPDYRRAV